LSSQNVPSDGVAGRLYHFVIAVWRVKETQSGAPMKFWEVIADNLSKTGWSWDCVATVDSNGKTIFVADAHRDNGKRFIVSADEKLRAFLELQRVTRESFRFPNAE
jgi:hypothetical protein